MPTITVSELHNAIYAYLPNIMRIANIQDNKLNKKIDAYISQIISLHPDTTITRLHSMFSMINAASKENVFYQNLLSYYDEQAKILYENICQGNKIWQNKVGVKLKQSILDISDQNIADPSNPAFLNYMAEILYAATIIPRAQEGGYEFLGFDVLMNNGKDADLQFRRIKDGVLIYFDNLSIHGVDVSKVNKSSDLYNFLKDRVDKKLDIKTAGLTSQKGCYIINNNVSEFYVAPILWSETCDLLPYKKAFQSFARNKNLSCLFVALQPQRLPTGEYHFSIETIENILLRWKKQECVIMKLVNNVRTFFAAKKRIK
ncbi:MAG: hypothetical protein UH084_02695 [Paludibacteraceae bacterium]|nr:hypothetical protein [Paludibacteraceae bacterium]